MMKKLTFKHKNLKVISYIILVAFILTIFIPIANAQEIPQAKEQGVFTIDSKFIKADGKIYEVDTAPFIEKDRTYVPIRFLAEIVGADVSWDGNKQEATLKLQNEKFLIFKIGEVFMNESGQYSLMDAVPKIVPPGRICLPARYVCEAAGYNVRWDEINRQVIVTPRK